jgi:hypothetical protein
MTGLSPIGAPHRSARGLRSLRLLSPAFLILSLSAASFAQNQSVVVPVDARTTALGEATVALHGDPVFMTVNPAGLASFTGASLSYSRRSMEWTSLLKGMYYQSFQAAVATPEAVFGAYYSRFTYGEFVVRSITNPEGESPSMEPYDHTIGLVGAITPIEGLSLGLAAKGFQYGGLLTGTEQETGRTGSSSWAILADLGVLYSYRFTTGPIGHDLSVGLSLQNFGSNVRIEHGETSSSEQLPRYLRAGLSYAVIGPKIEELGLVSCGVVVTGEYRNVLNAQSTYGNASRDFYGWGVEIQALEILSARLGWTLGNTNSVYGEAGTPAFRYGLAVAFPLRLIGAPLTVSGAYTSIRTTYPGWTGWAWPEFSESLPVFTLSVSYEGGIF